MSRALPLRYPNNAGTTIDFTADGYSHESPDLRAYEWRYDLGTGGVERFYREPAERSIEAWIDRWAEEEGFERRDRLLEAAERDVRSNTPGRFRVGDWYCYGHIVASNPDGHLADGRHMTTALKVLLPDPVWYRDHRHTFYLYDRDPGGEDDSDFPHGYPHGYANAYAVNALTNPSDHHSSFTLTVFGPAENPSVEIAGNIYAVRTVVEEGEHLVVDSRKRKIYVVACDGTATNAYAERLKGARDEGRYIFQQIPSGRHVVSLGGHHVSTVTIHEDRSAPQWNSSIPM
jgi:hypothetical protein